VLGNSKEGYDVNNQCTVADDIVFAENPTNKDLLKYLKSIDFFKKHVRLNMIEIRDDFEYIEILEKRTGKPICAFTKNY
jgi:hypothetical protein